MYDKFKAWYRHVRTEYNTPSAIAIAAWLVFGMRVIAAVTIMAWSRSMNEFIKEIACAVLLPAATTFALSMNIKKKTDRCAPFMKMSLAFLGVTALVLIGIALAKPDDEATTYLTMSMLGACITYAGMLPIFMTLFLRDLR